MQPYFYPIYPVPYWRNRYVPMVKYAKDPSRQNRPAPYVPYSGIGVATGKGNLSRVPNPVASPASTGGAPQSAKGGPRRAVSLGEALEAIILNPDARVYWMAQGRPLTREWVQLILDDTGLPYTLR